MEVWTVGKSVGMMAYEMVAKLDVCWVGCSEKRMADKMVGLMASLKAAVMVDLTAPLLAAMMAVWTVRRSVGSMVGLRVDQ